MPDIAGNSLATATPLNLTSAVQRFPDLVTPTAEDYYRFSLTSRNSVDISLTGLDANANLELLDGAGNVVVANGTPQVSANSGTFAESINTFLAPGVYYVRVKPGTGVPIANYTLNIAAEQVSQTSDILWRNPVSGETAIWSLNGTTFQTPIGVTPSPGVGWTVGGTGDFNGDGQSDIIWRFDDLTAIWLMNGTALDTAVLLPLPLNADWKVGGTGDFNRDGKLDILWRNSREQSTVVWFLDGTTFLSAASLNIPPLNSSWEVQGVGDFNKDGNPDILWRSEADSLAVIWLLDGINFSSAAGLPTINPGWRSGGAADFNNDGKLDILWRNFNAPGDVVVWLLDGTAFVNAAAVSPLGDLNWAASVAYNRPLGSLAPIDSAGDTIATAFDVGNNLTGQATYQSGLGGTDRDDFFRFSVNTASCKLRL
jgi:Bacterial pre-peptidase C-terminal domain/FG-GAP-like repeat